MTQSQPSPTPTQPLGYEAPPPVVTDQNARTWAMLCHLSALAGGLIPLGHIVIPLVIWQIKKSESPFIDDQGKEAVNFNISVTIYALIALLLVLVFIGFLLLPAIGIAAIILMIIAGLKANNGETYRYPLTIRFIK